MIECIAAVPNIASLIACAYTAFVTGPVYSVAVTVRGDGIVESIPGGILCADICEENFFF